MKAVFELGLYRLGLEITDQESGRFTLYRAPRLWERGLAWFRGELPAYQPLTTGTIRDDLALRKPRVVIDPGHAMLPEGAMSSLLYRWRLMQVRLRQDTAERYAARFRARSGRPIVQR